jgi:hypothetical protein
MKLKKNVKIKNCGQISPKDVLFSESSTKPTFQAKI